MVKRSFVWLLLGLVAAFAPSVAFAATDTVMAAATTAVTGQQGLLMGGLIAVTSFGTVIAMTLWGVPKAARFFKRVVG